MQITKLSTKGQVVIPESIRRNLKEGTSFIVTKKNDLIILKTLKGLNAREIKEMEELDRIWKEIDEGKGVTLSKEKFLKEMQMW